MNNYVIEHAKEHFIFACHKDKSPATLNGFKDATTDLDVLRKQFYSDDCFIGMPTGDINEIIVIDFDINKPMEDINGKRLDPVVIDTRTVEELKDEIREKFGELPDTFEVETLHGGRHLYYSLPNKTTNLSSSRRTFDKTLPVDVRANGGYVCAVDGKHYTVYDDVDGLDIAEAHKRMAPAPAWILNWKRGNVAAPSNVVQVDFSRPPMSTDEYTECRSALCNIPSDDRDTWIRIGMALKAMGAVDQFKGLWMEWSQKSDKFDSAEAEKKWATFKSRGDVTIASIIAEAQKYGFVSTYIGKKKKEEPVPDKPTITQEEIEQRVQEAAHQKKPFPKDLLRPDGFMGDVIDYMNSQAIKDQPILSLAATLALASTLTGRKVETETGVRTNLYIVGIGETGCGKDNARAVIKRLFQAADRDSYQRMCSIEDVTSDSAIYKAMQDNPCQLFMIDEIGKFLKTTTNATASPYLYGIQKAFLKLYSDSNQITFGKTYVDSKNNIELNNPHLVIYGTANATQFYDSLAFENVTDGMVSRMLFFESEDPDPYKRDVVRFAPPASLIEAFRHLLKLSTCVNPAGNLSAVLEVKPLIVPKTAGAKAMLDQFDRDIHDLRAILRKQNRVDVTYNRAGLTAEKIALLYAVTEDVYNPAPIITEKHMAYGIQLATYLNEHMQYVAEYYVWESDREKHVKRMLQMIRTVPGITITEVALKTQHLDTRSRDDILVTLQTCKLIEEEYVIDPFGSDKMVKAFIPSKALQRKEG